MLYVISHAFNSTVFEYGPVQYLLIGIILTSTYFLWREASIEVLGRSIVIFLILEGIILYITNESNINLQETLREYVTQNWALPIIILTTLSLMLMKKVFKKYQTR